jgi:anti-sigma B factor antagonist
MIEVECSRMQARDKFFSSLHQLRETAAIATSDAAEMVGVVDAGRRLDARSAERMKARFKQLVAQGRLHHILDLSRLDDLDSTGLAGLISTLRAVREAGGSVQIVASSNRVTQILELTALTRLFRVHPSIQSALTAN